jgi:hypothetical protein
VAQYEKLKRENTRLGGELERLEKEVLRQKSLRCALPSILRSARLPVNLIGSPINYANRLIGSPITSQSTGPAFSPEPCPKP